jgi:cobalamin biosynthesis protein CobD/CbiB
MVLRAIQERAGFIGRWIAGLLGVAWTLATFLVVPVMVNQEIGPFDAVKRSAELLKRTWGENLIGNAGIGLAFGLVTMLVIVAGAALVFVAISAHSTAAVTVVAVLCVLTVLTLTVIQSALHGIYAAAVYRYAEEGDAGAGFDKALVADAFRIKA